MVVDSSALVAIILQEDERTIFEDLILREPTVVMSIASLLEVTITLLGRRREADASRLEETLSILTIGAQAVDLQQGVLAMQAFTRFGRGRHQAALNFGDCFAYALAKARDEPLLFKGDDFSKTDVVPAWRRGS
jgi:ribonuclease VapC